MQFYCMQLRLPLFPVGTLMVSDCVGVYVEDGLVIYILNGMPVYQHDKDDLQGFRFFFCNLIKLGHCTRKQIRDAFHVTDDYVKRAYAKYTKEGESAFFGPENRHGYCHKLIGSTLERAQALLDGGTSQNATAKAVGVRESAIRYAIKAGYLKKNLSTNVR